VENALSSGSVDFHESLSAAQGFSEAEYQSEISRTLQRKHSMTRLDRRELVASEKVLRLEEIVLVEDFLLTGAGRKQIQNVRDPKPVTSNARTPPALAGLNRDPIQIVLAHVCNVTPTPCGDEFAMIEAFWAPRLWKVEGRRMKVERSDRSSSPS